MVSKKIPGIHNYCDRWCERCEFASRCAVYENEGNIPEEEKNLQNRAFWERLSTNFSKARTMLEQAAENSGIDLNSLAKEMDDYEIKKKRVRQESQDHELSKITFSYSERSREWLKSQPGMLRKLEELKDGLNLGTNSVDEGKLQIRTIKDCLEVIQWYQTFIHVKFMRALMGKMNNDDWDEEDDIQRDFNGSAKIAVIAVDRSMQAWIKLYELLPEQEDHFLKILGMLEKIKSMALAEFPNALAFKRPGFDD